MSKVVVEGVDGGGGVDRIGLGLFPIQKAWVAVRKLVRMAKNNEIYLDNAVNNYDITYSYLFQDDLSSAEKVVRIISFLDESDPTPT